MSGLYLYVPISGNLFLVTGYMTRSKKHSPVLVRVYQSRAGQEAEESWLPGRAYRQVLCRPDQGIPGTGYPGRGRKRILGERAGTGLAPVPDFTGNN